jgi:hypothetical protein
VDRYTLIEWERKVAAQQAENTKLREENKRLKTLTSDEIALELLDANEGLGEAQTRIGRALGITGGEGDRFSVTRILEEIEGFEYTVAHLGADKLAAEARVEVLTAALTELVPVAETLLIDAYGSAILSEDGPLTRARAALAPESEEKSDD